MISSNAHEPRTAAPAAQEPEPLPPPAAEKRACSSEAPGPPDAAPDDRGTTPSAVCDGQNLRALKGEALRRDGEELFRGCFEYAPFGIFVMGRDGRLIQANAAFSRMLGYSQKELPETAWSVLIYPADLVAAQRRQKQLWAGPFGSADAEIRFVHRSGIVVWCSIRVSMVRGSDGSPLYSVAHVREITERKEARKALGESEERFRIMADGCPTLLWVTDGEGGNRFVNRAYREFSGSTYEQVEGPKWQLLIHPDDLPGYGEAFHRAIREHTYFRAEARIRRADGTWRWFESYAAPRFSSDEEFLGHVGLSQDITERKQAEQAVRDSQDLAQSTIDALSSHVCVLNETGTIIAVNQAWKGFAEANQRVGHEVRPESPDSDCFGVGANYLATCDTAAGPEATQAYAFAAAIRAVLQGQRGQYSLEYSCHSPDERRWFIGRVTRFSIHSLPRILVEHIDITERKVAEHVLQSSEEKFRQLAENIHEVFWMTNLAATEMIYVSPAYTQVWGQTMEGLYLNPDSWMNSIHREDRERAREAFSRQVQGEIFNNEYRIVQPSGATRWISDHAFPVRDAAGKIVRLAGIAEDITERKLAELRLSHQALYDELTDLPNRRLFREKLTLAIAECANGKTGAVFFIDLDDFKKVNDTLGHSAGDELLKAVSGRLLAACGDSGTLGRFGGDEFTFVTTGFDFPEAATRLSHRLIGCLLAEPFKIGIRDVFVGASIGVSLFPKDGIEALELQRDADAAVHEAKRAGKNQVKFFSPELAHAALSWLEIESRLRRALALSEFKLQFQPEFVSGKPIPSRFEALIRWYPPDSEPVAPLSFIPIAEQIGLIVPIGTWVLQEACRQCAGWQTGNLKGAGVAVNVSADQFASPDFAEIVTRTLESTGLIPPLLELEVTESVFIDDLNGSISTLKRLRALGVTIALDDFGTGYSSLSYLRTLPLDAIKIDRSFLIETGSRQEGTAILRCVVDLAHTLGLRVICEGVETSAQLDLLGSLGCDEIQGFLSGRPVFDVNSAGYAGTASPVNVAPESDLSRRAMADPDPDPAAPRQIPTAQSSLPERRRH